MSTPPTQTRSLVAKLAQQVTAMRSPRSVAAKLYTIMVMALVVIVLLGSITLAMLDQIDTSSQQIALNYELSQRTEDLFRSTLQLSQELSAVHQAGNTSGIPAILAQNESLVSDFASYRSLVEAHNLENDAVFILENESLILKIREDVYQALNLHRTGAVNQVTEVQARIDRNILHLATAIERSAAQRQHAVEDEVKNLALLRQQQIWWMGAIFAGGALLLFGASFGYARSIVVNLKHLATAANEVATGNYAHRIATTSGDEIARLAASFNHMATSVQDREEWLKRHQTLEQHAAELEQALADLRKTVGERDQLTLSIRELSSPVLPISPGIIVMPLIGIIDTERVALLNHALLTAIQRYQAKITIIDVTGVPIIDTQVAGALLDAAKAARLLGTQTVLVGLRPELAQTIVGLGVSLSDVATRADLQSGISYAFQQHRQSNA